jgi:hypothetical protein
MRLVVQVSMALVAVAAFALSFQSLTTLGGLAGYGGLAWLYPVVVDLGTVSSCATWLATRSRQAFRMTWNLLVISVLQNGTVHWLIATGQRPEWWLITLVATVPPIVLGLTVHLGVSLGREQAERARAERDAAEAAARRAAELAQRRAEAARQRSAELKPRQPQTPEGAGLDGAAPEDELEAKRRREREKKAARRADPAYAAREAERRRQRRASAGQR